LACALWVGSGSWPPPAKADPRGAEQLVDPIWARLAQQTVVVPGTAAADAILPKLDRSLADTLDQRRRIATQVEQVLDVHPRAEVLTSMPGVGVRTSARILLPVGDGSSCPTAAHPAAYGGLAPVTHRSGISIRGQHPARSGNKHLKRAFFPSAFAPLRADPISRTCYDRKRAEGRKHNAALSASPDAAARRRLVPRAPDTGDNRVKQFIDRMHHLRKGPPGTSPPMAETGPAPVWDQLRNPVHDQVTVTVDTTVEFLPSALSALAA